MTRARPADFAGTWYPGDAASCDRFFDAVTPYDVASLDLRSAGAIVPHAGWLYSGAIAYRALKALRDSSTTPDLILVFGGHLGPRDKPRLLIDGAMATPYGELPIARALAEDIGMSVECETETPSDYHEDNAIEVLMPMVKKLWPEVAILTLGAPPLRDSARLGREVVELAKARDYRNILAIGSTDLTHYGPNYRFNPAGIGAKGLEWVKTVNDPEIVRAMERFDAAEVVWVADRKRNACCAGAAAAAISAAKALGATRGVAIDYATSFDVHPDAREPTSFVGYVGMLLA